MPTVKKRLATKTLAVLVGRSITDGDVGFPRFFGEDVLFSRLSKRTDAFLQSLR